MIANKMKKLIIRQTKLGLKSALFHLGDQGPAFYAGITDSDRNPNQFERHF